jgi:hypothetical protein
VTVESLRPLKLQGTSHHPPENDVPTRHVVVVLSPRERAFGAHPKTTTLAGYSAGGVGASLTVNGIQSARTFATGPRRV